MKTEGKGQQRGTPTIVQTCGFWTTVHSSFGELSHRDRRYLTTNLNANVRFIKLRNCLAFCFTLRHLLSVQWIYSHTEKHQE